jgi:site-specific DNA-methyltransferase (adenine-specific)
VRELNQVYQCPFKELLQDIPDKTIDLLLIDPPYGLNIGKMNFTRSTKGGIAKRTDYSNHDTRWDEATLSADDIKELFRVSKNQIIFGGNYIGNLLRPSKCWVVWDKRTHEKYNNDFADCELAWTSFDKPSRVIRFLWSGMMQQDMKHKEKRVHPTQKPVAVMKQIIETYSQENDLIMDCFCGSGSSLIAAKQLNRRYIGCDGQQAYVELTRQRLSSC